MTADGSEPAVRAFFDAFGRASEAGDWASYGTMFLPTFMSLDPNAAAPVDRDRLIAFLPHRRQLFERAGVTGTRLSELSVTDLDDRHAIAQTTWAVDFDVPRDPVVLRSTFLLRRDDVWRIAVYLNHDVLGELLASPTPSDPPEGGPNAARD